MTEKKPPKPLNIYQRLHKVMEGISYVQKEDKKVNNQYRYVSHDAVTAAIRPHLIEHGVICFPQHLVVNKDGNRVEAYFDLRFLNISDPDDFIDVPTFGYGIDAQDKGPGKAMSYGVKYGLLKALGLETGDDPEKDLIDHKPLGGGLNPAEKSGNPAVEKTFNQALTDINNCIDVESATAIARTSYKILKDSGASEGQLDLIKQQLENHKTYLQSKEA